MSKPLVTMDEVWALQEILHVVTSEADRIKVSIEYLRERMTVAEVRIQDIVSKLQASKGKKRAIRKANTTTNVNDTTL